MILGACGGGSSDPNELADDDFTNTTAQTTEQNDDEPGTNEPGNEETGNNEPDTTVTTNGVEPELVAMPADFQPATPPALFGDLAAPIRYNIDYADTPTNTRVYANENNSARLTGPLVGTGVISNYDNVKPLLLFGPTDSAHHRVVAAYAMRSSVFPEGQTKVMLAVENPSSELMCHHLARVSFTHKENHEVYGLEFNSQYWQYSVDGHAVQNDRPHMRSDCVPADGIVYAIEDAGQQSGTGALDELLLFDEITGATGGRGTAGSLDNVQLEPLGNIKPISYAISENGLRVEITVRNEDPLSRYRIRQTSVYLLDEQGMPVGHVQALGGAAFLEPGEEGIVTFPQAQFQGSVSSMRVVVEAKIP